MNKKDSEFSLRKIQNDYTLERVEIIDMRENTYFWVDEYRTDRFQLFYQYET